MDEKPNLRRVFGLYSLVMSIGIGGIAAGLMYKNSQDAEPSIPLDTEISVPENNETNPQP